MPSNQDEAAVMAAITAAIPLYLEQAAKADSPARWRIAGRLAMLKSHAIQPVRDPAGKWRAARHRANLDKKLGWG